MTEAVRACVCGVGLVAPGIVDWQQGRQIFCGREKWQPQPLAIPSTSFLPAAERRRTGKAIQLALACGHQAVAGSGRSPADLASVFASADVDAENTHQICIALNEAEPSLSPTRFHNSVQNAVSGYWTILTGSRAPTTMLMGADEVLAMGLHEAVTQAATGGQPVLLVVFDIPMPPPLYAAHPIEGGGALALVLDASAHEGPIMGARLVRDKDRRDPEARGGSGGTVAPEDTGWPGGLDDGFDALRATHPVGRAVPLLERLARHGQVDHADAPPPAGTNERGFPIRLKFDRYHSLEVTID